LFINVWDSGIHAIDLLTHAKTGVIRGLKKNRGMAINTVEKKIYFGNGSSISRANLDGTGVEVLSQTVGDVFGISVDWLGDRLFFIAIGDGHRRIYVIYSVGKERTTTLKTTSISKWDIAVDPTVG
jgi:hypothetical protein